MVLESDKCTGIPGLDQVLVEGIPLNRTLLVEGPPGSGKTTFGLQFLFQSVRQGESALYITLAETRSEMEAFAQAHGWSLEGITVLELLPEEYRKGEAQTFFHPGEVEAAAISKRIITEVSRLRPARLVIDSLSDLRTSLPDDTRFHRQLTALKQALTETGTTAVLLYPHSDKKVGAHIQTIVHGVIELDVTPRTYGTERRRLRVAKMREVAYVPGYHDYELSRGGITVYPRVVESQESGSRERDILPSGIPQLDELLGGGIQRSTSTLLIGTTGTGKSSVAAQYAMAAAARGERTHIFLFDESVTTFVLRSEGLGLPIESAVRDGLITFERLDPAVLGPGEFAHRVRHSADAQGARVIVVDSLSGYLNALPEENALLLQMHELLSYLHRRNVTTFLLMAQAGVFSANSQAALDLSYLTDTVIMLRAFEVAGAVRKAISVLKKRYGVHENTIREFRMEPGRIRVGPVLREFEGVMTGTPHYVGQTGPGTMLMESTDDDDKQR